MPVYLVPMKVYCPDCGAQIPAEDLDLQTLLARCRKCDSVFSFADAARAEMGRAALRVAGPEAAAEVPRPPRIRVEEGPATWVARWRWFSPVVLFMVLFCIAWDGFLVFWYSMAFATHGPWLMVVFPVLHVAVGISLTYGSLATLLNSTTIRVSRGELEVHSGPLPWIGNRTLPAVRVKQVFSRVAYTHNYNGATWNNATWNGAAWNNGKPSLALFAVLEDGNTIRLAGGLNASSEAAFLQQQLERRLNLRPTPLPTTA